MANITNPDAGKIFGRGLAFPPRVGSDGRIAWSVGVDNVRESIRIILLTEPGERIMLPDFGGKLRSYLFEPNTPATRRLIQEEIKNALTRWERRIQLISVTVDADDDDGRAAVAAISYKLIANGAEGQVNLRLQLAG